MSTPERNRSKIPEEAQRRMDAYIDLIISIVERLRREAVDASLDDPYDEERSNPINNP